MEFPIVRKFRNINVWKQGYIRAPHKPLLLLYALSRCARGEPRKLSYREIDQNLRPLLMEFGPVRRSYHTEYPFWRLQNDGVWAIDNAEDFEPRKGHTDARKSELLKKEAMGGFPKWIYETLQSEPTQLQSAINIILKDNFPQSIHADILSAVGLNPEGFPKTKRDPEFRNRVLRAYEYRCAVCEFDVRLGNTTIGLDAAHIRWHQAGGPDIENNGLSLCVLHHKLFDRGAFTLTDQLEIWVSELANGSRGFKDWLLDFHGRKIAYPIITDYEPASHFIVWHHTEVFKKPGRSFHLRIRA